MGNCQAIDNASLVVQHPSGRVDTMYLPIGASEIMKMNPGHYVALLLTTTVYSSAAATGGGGGATDKKSVNNGNKNSTSTPLRITRIKLLRPTDTLVLGHAYRLVTSQEVTKGVFAKKHGKTKQQQPMCGKITTDKMSYESEKVTGKNHQTEKIKQAKHESHKSRNKTVSANSVVSKSRGWQPSLKSISEAGS